MHAPHTVTKLFALTSSTHFEGRGTEPYDLPRKASEGVIQV